MIHKGDDIGACRKTNIIDVAYGLVKGLSDGILGSFYSGCRRNGVSFA